MKHIILILLVIGSVFANPPRTLSADRVHFKVDGGKYSTVITILCIEKTKWVLRFNDTTPPIQLMYKYKNQNGEFVSLPVECD